MERNKRCILEIDRLSVVTVPADFFLLFSIFTASRYLEFTLSEEKKKQQKKQSSEAELMQKQAVIVNISLTECKQIRREEA